MNAHKVHSAKVVFGPFETDGIIYEYNDFTAIGYYYGTIILSCQ